MIFCSDINLFYSSGYKKNFLSVSIKRIPCFFFWDIQKISYHKQSRDGASRGVVVNVLDCYIVGSEFEL